MKKILTDIIKVRIKLLDAANLMNTVVGATYGAKGLNVAIGRPWGYPLVISDGVTVAKEIEHPDEFVNIGVKLIQEAASKTVQQVGDGTTGSTILVYHLIDKGFSLIESGKINGRVLRREIEATLPILREELKKISKPVKDIKDLQRIAFISAADETLGNIVAEAVDKIGIDGTIAVEESNNDQTTVSYTEGYQIDKGWNDPIFVTNPNRMEAVVADPFIILLGKKVTTKIEIVPILEFAMQEKKEIVLIGDISGPALQLCMNNKYQGALNLLVIDTPGIKQDQSELLADIASATGATILKDQLGMPPQLLVQNITYDMFGSAESVISTNKTSVVIQGKGNPTDRIVQLKERLKNSSSLFEKEKLQERLAKLTTNVAVIRVGGKTEVEQREKIERVKDAVGATTAAKAEGIVAGGGVAFMRISEILIDKKSEGARLMLKVLQEPIKRLLSNAGKTDEQIKDIMVEIQKKPKDYGFEVNGDTIVDMVSEGVVDPAKVIRSALENSVAVAGSILTTAAIIADERTENNEQLV